MERRIFDKDAKGPSASGTMLPFSRVDLVPRAAVQIYFLPEVSRDGTSGRRDLNPTQYKIMQIDARLTSRGLIEQFFKKIRQTDVSADDYVLYEAKFKSDQLDHTVRYERPMGPSEIPVLVLANTAGSEEVCCFILQRIVDVLTGPIIVLAPFSHMTVLRLCLTRLRQRRLSRRRAVVVI